jgi:hypothetical protein
VTEWEPEFPGYLNPTSELPAANPHSIQLEDLQAMFSSGYFHCRSFLKLDTLLTPDRIAARCEASRLLDLQQVELLKIAASKWGHMQSYKESAQHRKGKPHKRGPKLGSKHLALVTAANAKAQDDLMEDLIDQQF